METVHILFQDKNFILRDIKVLFAEWILIAILLLYPVFATISLLLQVPSTPISMSYRAFYLGMSLVIILGESLELLKLEKRYSFYLFILLSFWIVYVMRMHYDFNVLGLKEGFAAGGFVFFFQYGFLGSFIPAFAIGMMIKKINYQRLFRHTRLVCFPVVLCLIYVIHHEFGLSADIFVKRFYLSQEDDVILGPIIISQYGGLAALTFFYSICHQKFTIFDAIFWLIGMALLVVGASRGPLIAIFVTHLLIVCYLVKTRFKSVRLWAGVSAILVVVVAGVIKFIVPNLEQISLFNRVKNSVETGEGLDARGLQWSAAWNQFLDSPIIGDAVIEKSLNFYPHNLILEILMSTGIIGGTFFFILLFKSISNYFLIKDTYGRFIIYVMILYLTYAMFSLSLIANPQFWCTLIIATCMNTVLFSSSETVLLK